MAVRSSHAEWQGNLRDGNGSMKLGSGMFEGPFTFASRFENGKGTNPEELIGAAHAGCFSMAFSGQLNEAGLNPEEIRTTATVTMDKTDAGPTVTRIHLDVHAKVPGADKAAFETAANNAKAGCPISRLLNAEITMEAELIT